MNTEATDSLNLSQLDVWLRAAGVDMSISWSVVVWMLAAVVISVLIGAYLGRCWTLHWENKRIRNERETTLQALLQLVSSTEQLTSDVDSHNSELESVGNAVGDLPVSKDLEQVQDALIGHIGEVMESNKKLENDLVGTRYQLELQAQELDRTRKEARTDQLAQIPNRKGFEERLEYMLSRFRRDGSSFGMLLLDIDYFKWINDTHGHQSGDQVIARLAESMQEMLRQHDFVGRIGGDEFAILLAKLTPEDAAVVSERMRQKIDRSNFDVGVDNSKVAVTLSMGLAWPQEDDTPQDILHRADVALYKSKRCGRNQLNIYEETLEEEFEAAALLRSENPDLDESRVPEPAGAN